MGQLAMPLPMDAIRDFCRRWKVRELAVFGSILRDDFRADSDVDFLVTWEPDARWTFRQYLDAQDELARIVGRRVDLVERAAVDENPNWIRRQEILRTAEVVHAA
jgi:predicted nucleotidyltransferase